MTVVVVSWFWNVNSQGWFSTKHNMLILWIRFLLFVPENALFTLLLFYSVWYYSYSYSYLNTWSTRIFQLMSFWWIFCSSVCWVKSNSFDAENKVKDNVAFDDDGDVCKFVVFSISNINSFSFLQSKVSLWLWWK